MSVGIIYSPINNNTNHKMSLIDNLKFTLMNIITHNNSYTSGSPKTALYEILPSCTANGTKKISQYTIRRKCSQIEDWYAIHTVQDILICMYFKNELKLILSL
jgi:arginine/lysine/ornithine decarboxylase